MIRVSYWLCSAGVLALTLTGCASRFEKMTRTRAATDFNCAADEVDVAEQRSALTGAEYTAQGCDRSDTYQINCSIIGICKMYSSAEVAERQAAYRRQQAARAARPPSPPPSSSSSSSSSPPPAPTSSSSSSSSSLPKNCSFNSDCGPGVKCNSGRCANTEGSKCGFDSDCGGNGAKCNSGKCSNAPDGRCAFNSECPGGSCSSGKCKF